MCNFFFINERHYLLISDPLPIFIRYSNATFPLSTTNRRTCSNEKRIRGLLYKSKQMELVALKRKNTQNIHRIHTEQYIESTQNIHRKYSEFSSSHGESTSCTL